MGTRRDTHKSKVYNAEFALRDLLDSVRAGDSPTTVVGGSTLHVRVDGLFSSLDEIQRYVNGVLGDMRVLATWGDVRPITVVKRDGDGKAHYRAWDKTIAIPTKSTGWAWREVVVLHEISHHLVAERYGRDVAGHGAEFVATFIRLVEFILGGETGLLLTLTMAQSGGPDFWKPLADLRTRAVA